MIFQIIWRNLSSDSHCWIPKWSLKLRQEARKARLGCGQFASQKPGVRRGAWACPEPRSHLALGTQSSLRLGPELGCSPDRGLPWGWGLGRGTQLSLHLVLSKHVPLWGRRPPADQHSGPLSQSRKAPPWTRVCALIKLDFVFGMQGRLWMSPWTSFTRFVGQRLWPADTGCLDSMTL